MFLKLNVESLGKIRSMLESKLPVSAQILNMVNMQLKNRYPEEDQMDFYGYQGVPSDICSLFIVVSCIGKHYATPTVAVFEPDNVTDDMWTSFCNFIDWSKAQEIEGVSTSFGSSLERIANDKGGRLMKYPLEDMYLPVADALKIDLSESNLNESFELRKLSPGHGATVNAHWRYGSERGALSMTDIIKTMGGIGTFRKSTCAPGSTGSGADGNESDLVSWMVCTRLGTLGALHTLEEYRRRGIGAWTLAAAAKWMADEGFVPACQVEEYNKESWNLVQKVGFRSSRKALYTDYYPPNSE